MGQANLSRELGVEDARHGIIEWEKAADATSARSPEIQNTSYSAQSDGKSGLDGSYPGTVGRHCSRQIFNRNVIYTNSLCDSGARSEAVSVNLPAIKVVVEMIEGITDLISIHTMLYNLEGQHPMHNQHCNPG